MGDQYRILKDFLKGRKWVMLKKQLFASKYKLWLPTEEELKTEIETALAE